MAKHFNITGALTKEVLAAGDNTTVSSIWITNTHSSDDVTVDLYIEKKLTGKFYYLKGKSIPNAGYLQIKNILISTSQGNFGLYIKLNNANSAVDILIN